MEDDCQTTVLMTAYSSVRPKPHFWFRPRTYNEAKDGCHFLANTETNQNKQILFILSETWTQI